MIRRCCICIRFLFTGLEITKLYSTVNNIIPWLEAWKKKPCQNASQSIKTEVVNCTHKYVIPLALNIRVTQTTYPIEPLRINFDGLGKLGHKVVFRQYIISSIWIAKWKRNYVIIGTINICLSYASFTIYIFQCFPENNPKNCGKQKIEWSKNLGCN